MNGKQKLVLQWEDFNLGASEVFKNIQFESDFCDVSLRCNDSNGEVLEAHKVIIATFSSVFKNMLQGYGHNRASSNTALFLRGIQHKHLSAILDFIYQGEVHVDEAELNIFLSVADDLKIKGLSSERVLGENSTHHQTINYLENVDPLMKADVKIKPFQQGLMNANRIGNVERKKHRVKQETLLKDISDSTSLDTNISNEIAPIKLCEEMNTSSNDCLDVQNETNVLSNRIRRRAPEINEYLSKVAESHTSRKPGINSDVLKVEKSKANRGGFNLINDGYAYHVSTCTAYKLLWQCRRRKLLSCKASLTTDIEVTKVMRRKDHNHGPSKMHT